MADGTAMLRGHQSLVLPRFPLTVFWLAIGVVLLASCAGGTDEVVPDSIAFADDVNAATLNGITILCEPDGVTVHSEDAEIENIVLSIDGVHTRVDNIFAHNFVVAGAFDRMTVDSDPTVPGDDLPKNRIEAMWVKAGDNLSPDGPGYGQRMTCPTPAVEAAREAAATKNYVEHEFGDVGGPADDLAAVDVEPDDVALPSDQPSADSEMEVAEEPVAEDPVSAAQVFDAGGNFALSCGANEIEVRSTSVKLASVVAFDNAAGEQVKFVDVGSQSLSLVGDYGPVTAVTVDGDEATLSCAVAERRAGRAGS